MLMLKARWSQRLSDQVSCKLRCQPSTSVQVAIVLKIVHVYLESRSSESRFQEARSPLPYKEKDATSLFLYRRLASPQVYKGLKSADFLTPQWARSFLTDVSLRMSRWENGKCRYIHDPQSVHSEDFSSCIDNSVWISSFAHATYAAVRPF